MIMANYLQKEAKGSAMKRFNESLAHRIYRRLHPDIVCEV
jgi:Fe-S cluster biosynthesis and repair protein YggX